jgi:hypothetical protein
MLVAGKVTTKPDFIRAWVSERQGWPALRRNPGTSGSEYRLFIGFPDTPPDKNIIRVNWETFINKFERDRLSFMYEETEAHGDLARFYYFL